MQINKGEKSDFIERFHGVELALRDVTDPAIEQVITIPQELLKKGGLIYDPKLPFKLKIHHFGVNCDFDFAKKEESLSDIYRSLPAGWVKQQSSTLCLRRRTSVMTHSILATLRWN